jgi:hypothetical protein
MKNTKGFARLEMVSLNKDGSIASKTVSFIHPRTKEVVEEDAND